MSAPLIEPPTASGAIVDTTRCRTGMARLSVGVFVVLVSLFAPLLGTSVVLLPARLADIVPDQKVSVLAALSAAAAILAFLSALIFGTISDRTRHRLGRRNPWVLVGTGLTSGATLLVAEAHGLPLLAVAFLLQVVGANIALGAIQPVMPDRVPIASRGRVSTAIGLGTLIGGTLGIGAASAFLDSGFVAYLTLAVICLVFGALYQVLAPDFSSKGDPRAAEDRRIFASMAFPKNAPDFYWAFFGRFAVMLGYYTISGYQLYILTDYLELDNDAAARLLSTAALVNLAGALIGALLGGPISDLIKRRKPVTMLSAAFIAFGVLIPLLVPSELGFLAYMGISGIGLGMFLSVDSALLSQVLPPGRTHGKNLGILALATNAGQFVGPLIGSGIVAAVGFSLTFVAGCIIAGIGALLIVPIKGVR